MVAAEAVDDRLAEVADAPSAAAAGAEDRLVVAAATQLARSAAVHVHSAAGEETSVVGAEFVPEATSRGRVETSAAETVFVRIRRVPSAVEISMAAGILTTVDLRILIARSPTASVSAR